MALSGMLHAYDLPAWMYHAQTPPPDYHFDPTLPGLTWVDLVFPFFLFTMGAAMPLALVRRIDQGQRWWQLAAYAVRRGVLLLAFALYVEHVIPWKFELAGRVSAARWLWALLALAVLFPALARLPRSWPKWTVRATRLTGWGGAATILATVHYPDGGGFSWGRADIIIVVLAHTAVVGSLLWLVSRNSLPLRLGFMIAVLAIILGAEAPGWMRQLWHGQPQAFVEIVLTELRLISGPLADGGTTLLLFGYLKYLLIVLPGTIAGDLLLAWLRDADSGPVLAAAVGRNQDPGGCGDPAPRTPWPGARCVGIACLTLGLCVFTCAGLQARWLPGTTWIAFAACAAGARLFGQPTTAGEMLLRRLYGWGVLWLAVGLLLEPWQGGIKKDDATLSYYFVTSGLAIFALIFLTIIIDHFRQRRRLWLLIDSGQNPMIAYIGIRNLLPPILGLLAIEHLIAPCLQASAWLGFGWACVKTLLLAAAVSVFTRLRVFWRT